MCEDKQKVSLFRVIAYGFRFNLRFFPVLFISVGAVGALHGAVSGITVFVTQHFYDSVGDALAGGGTASGVYLMIAALGLTLIFRELLGGAEGFMRAYISDNSKRELAKIIHTKMARISPVCLEDTDLLEDITKAEEGAGTIMPIMNTVMGILTFFVPYFTVMGFYLHHLKPQFIIALVFIPVLAAQLFRVGITAKFEDTSAPFFRENNFNHWAFTARRYYKETRALGAATFFAKRYVDVLKKIDREQLKMTWKANSVEFISGFLSMGGYAVILVMLVSALLNGEITVGAFAAVFGSIDMLFRMVRDMVQNNIGQMMSNMGRAHNFIRFLDLPELEGDGAAPDYAEGITAENVSFTYPHAKQKSVDGVSLTINAGETVAIVGANGAGKTTLVRLLTGLYPPTEGAVTVNGMDTRKIKPSDIFKGISGVFQNFQKYMMTLKENVQISDRDNTADITPVLEQAGVELNGKTFPNGAETMLSREFYGRNPDGTFMLTIGRLQTGGVDLSGGQWQRVAIARGLYRERGVVVLDEPTAAIDPLEESRIYNQFVEISKGKTAIIVTHRLGSTKIADRVAVMDKGRIVDVGSHNELMRKNGLYAEMYKSQAGWYYTGNSGEG